jgi:putative N6-adenine-specific DNA methylase
MEKLFAVTAPGLEPVALKELQRLGLLVSTGDAGVRMPGEEGGGVAFEGELGDLYRANLHLRVASRVLVRVGEFYAANFSELRKKAARLAWERFVQPGQPVEIHATSHKSRLYHSGGVAERVVGAIGDRLGSLPGKASGKGQPAAELAPQRVVVRLVRDLCTLSVDSSGELLHRRGYRLATAKAPLRETLAAAMLLASGWDERSPLLDPFCGSGTIPIEAAMLAIGIPPGRNRQFAFMEWPGYDAPLWQRLLQEAPIPDLAAAPVIQASDRDAGAVEMARANAERAGVLDAIAFSQRAVSAVEPPPGPGWVVTNPPYGLRVSEGKDLRNLYAQTGNVLRAHAPGWHVAILSSDIRLLGHTGLKLDTSFSTVNGGVNVRLGRGEVPA